MNEKQEQLEHATQHRLGKLAAMSVDLSRLEKRLAHAIDPEGESPAAANPYPVARGKTGWLRVAAVVALFVGVSAAAYFAFFQVAPSTAVAQTMTISQLHRHLMDDPQSTYRARTVARAQDIIDTQLSGQLALPILDGTQVESCCLVEGNFPLRAALVIDHPDGAVTITIAQGEGFAHPMHTIDHPSGVPMQGHEYQGLPMVMRNVGDLWMCVMGEPGGDHLSDIAASIHLPPQ